MRYAGVCVCIALECGKWDIVYLNPWSVSCHASLSGLHSESQRPPLNTFSQFHARQCKLLYPSASASCLHPHVNRGSNSLQFEGTLPHCKCPSLTAYIHMLQRSCAPAFAKAPIHDSTATCMHCSLRGTSAVVQSISRPISHYVFQGSCRRGSAVIYMSRLSGCYDITSCRLQFICSCTPPFLGSAKNSHRSGAPTLADPDSGDNGA